MNSIAESDYEGWVAWVEGSPIFEAEPFNVKLAPLFDEKLGRPARKETHQTLDWKKVPNEKIERLDLYFARKVYKNQPVIRIDKEPGHNWVRFVQMKLGSMIFGPTEGARRLGISGYRIGYWDTRRNICEIFEYHRDGTTKQLPPVANPFLPKPQGFGYSRSVIGE